MGVISAEYVRNAGEKKVYIVRKGKCVFVCLWVYFCLFICACVCLYVWFACVRKRPCVWYSWGYICIKYIFLSVSVFVCLVYVGLYVCLTMCLPACASHKVQERWCRGPRASGLFLTTLENWFVSLQKIRFNFDIFISTNLIFILISLITCLSLFLISVSRRSMAI